MHTCLTAPSLCSCTPRLTNRHSSGRSDRWPTWQTRCRGSHTDCSARPGSLQTEKKRTFDFLLSRQPADRNKQTNTKQTTPPPPPPHTHQKGTFDFLLFRQPVDRKRKGQKEKRKKGPFTFYGPGSLQTQNRTFYFFFLSSRQSTDRKTPQKRTFYFLMVQAACRQKSRTF